VFVVVDECLGIHYHLSGKCRQIDWLFNDCGVAVQETDVTIWMIQVSLKKKTTTLTNAPEHLRNKLR